MRSPRRVPSGASVAAPAPVADGATRTLWACLVVLALARAVAAFLPGMWLWGIHLHRFLPPAAAWVPWALAAAALIPPVARAIGPAVEWIGGAIVRGGAFARLAAGALAAALVWSLPDNVRYVGDFLMREGTVRTTVKPMDIWPQALPLDVALHYTLPFASARLGDALVISRLTGALEVALLAWLAMAFASTLALRGGAAVATASVVFFGGTLGLFTGYGKAFMELVVLVAAAGVLGLRAVRGERGLLALGAVTAVALALHRSALGFLPAFAFAWWVGRSAYAGGTTRAPRGHHAERGPWSVVRGWRAIEPWAALALPAIALGVMGPKILHTLLHVDPVHFAAAEGGPLRAVFAGTRAIDMLNLVLALSPLAILIPALAIARRGPTLRSRDALVLALLALPFAAMVPLIHPVNGMFRDWDDFAATGEALSLVAAWLVAESLRGAPRAAGLAAGVALAVAVPSVQWLAHHHDAARGMARVEAAMREPPMRSAAERGRGWDFLGARNVQLGRFGEATDDFHRGVETSPSSRMLLQWALAAVLAGRLTEAQEAYRLHLAKDPASAAGWYGLAVVSMRLSDESEGRRALDEFTRLRPDDPSGLRLRAALDQAAARRAATAPPQ